ncbi:hypothetical protein PAXRUDRAFT_159356, partial [Paxillus rubicundulus Ve08.2h10]
CPKFPDSEWNNIILGKLVNLNTVFSGMFTSQSDERHKEKFGDLKITCGVSSSPSKTILTGQDWHTAWVHTACVYWFAFPHQASELKCYREYLTQKFAHHEQHFHGRVIKFDKSICKQVGSSQQHELTNPHANLFESHFLPSGKQFTETPTASKPKKSSSSLSSVTIKDEAC